MSPHHSETISRRKIPQLRHGHVFQPASRAFFAWQAGLIDDGALNQRESGKFFPATLGNLPDPFAPTDQPNVAPPADGKIASAGQLTGQILDEPGSHWKKHEVHSGKSLDVSWHFTANHVTRRFNYFITKENWNPSLPLSRAQFEPEPFYTVQINLQPFWEHSDEMKPSSPTTHELILPERKGYHVLLAVWEVADTANAFYQVVDLDFKYDEGSSERPETPGNLEAVSVTDKTVELSWSPSEGMFPIEKYRITRNGITTIDIPAPLQNWTDNSVVPESVYSYFISAIDINGNISLPGRAIEVTTLPAGGGGAQPAAPKNLHEMGITASSVNLMWTASVSNSSIINYIIYRDGREIKRIAGHLTAYKDTSLNAETTYRYFVAALDTQGLLSVPSEVLTVKTTSGEDGENYQDWKLKNSYAVGDIVHYSGRNWICLQAHIAYELSWAPGAEDSSTLWALYSEA